MIRTLLLESAVKHFLRIKNFFSFEIFVNHWNSNNFSIKIIVKYLPKKVVSLLKIDWITIFHKFILLYIKKLTIDNFNNH